MDERLIDSLRDMTMWARRFRNGWGSECDREQFEAALGRAETLLDDHRTPN